MSELIEIMKGASEWGKVHFAEPLLVAIAYLLPITFAMYILFVAISFLEGK